MKRCNKLIDNGMIIRYILTIVSFKILSMNLNHHCIRENIYLILPILLAILDEVDNIFTTSYKDNRCTKLFRYQSSDKICDSISYLLLFLSFDIDRTFLFFTLYRIIGVILFTLSRNSRWLIIFLDFSKEYLLYYHFFQDDQRYLPIFMFGKFCFEYYYHTIHNKNEYNKKMNY